MKRLIVSWNRVRFFAAVFLSGCAAISAAAAAPEWVSGPSRNFPPDTHLTGVGNGDTRQAAEDRAYAALSKIFAAEIESKTHEWEKYLQTDGAAGAVDHRQIGIEQATRVSTRAVLEDVKIVGTWFDESKAAYYALAAMDRRHASSSLRERIRSLDLKVEELLKVSAAADQKLQTVRALHEAVQSLLLRDAYNAQLRIVSVSGTGVEAPARLDGVSRKLKDFLVRSVRIRVEVGGGHNEAIRDAIVEGLNRRGLPVISTGSEADLNVDGRVSFEPVNLPNASTGTHFVRWSAVFDLTDRASGQKIGTVTQQGREGHLSAVEADARAVRASQTVLSEEVGRQLANFIYGETDNP
ncbi:MAG TPA: LPP20 family lipoprotein [Nitrospiria bacterium]